MKGRIRLNEEFVVRKDKLIDILMEMVIPILLCIEIVYYLCRSMTELYQVPKDLCFLKASLGVMALIIVVRRIPFKRYITWVSFFVGGLAVFAVCKLKPINVELYGEVYFRVLLFQIILVVVSIVLLIDSAISGELIKVVKNANVLWHLFVITAIVATVIDRGDIVPLVCPTFALMITKIDGKKWIKLMDCFSIGYYITFVYLFTRSLIERPEYYENGRYIGSFLTVGAAGMIAGGAAIASLYFIGKYISVKKRSMIGIAVSLASLIYPIFAIFKVNSRSPQAGVLLALFGFFIFEHGKGRQATKKRVIISALVALALVVGVLGYSRYLNYQYDMGRIEDEDISYWQSHLMPLTNADLHQHEFGNNFVLNALDRFSSSRLAQWKLCLSHVGWGPAKLYDNPHNFFIEWLEDYGAIAGGLLIVVFIIALGICIRRNWKGDASAAMPLLWILYCLGVFSFTTMKWRMILPAILLLCIYPLMFKPEEVTKDNDLE